MAFLIQISRHLCLEIPIQQVWDIGPGNLILMIRHISYSENSHFCPPEAPVLHGQFVGYTFFLLCQVF